MTESKLLKMKGEHMDAFDEAMHNEEETHKKTEMTRGHLRYLESSGCSAEALEAAKAEVAKCEKEETEACQVARRAVRDSYARRGERPPFRPTSSDYET